MVGNTHRTTLNMCIQTIFIIMDIMIINSLKYDDPYEALHDDCQARVY